MSARGVLVCLVVLGACGGTSQACIDGSQVWAAADIVCVRGDLIVEGRQLDELVALADIEQIEGSLLVHDNPALLGLPVLPALKQVGGALSISGNVALTDVHGFPALEHIGGGLYVAENPLLSRLDLGSELASVGSIFVALNPRLVDLVVPPSLGQIEGDLKVAENTGLEKITSSGLSKIGGDFLLEENSALLTAEFPALTSVAGALTISDNLALASMAGFKTLEQVGSLFTIRRNDALEGLSLTTAMEVPFIFIVENASLARISGPSLPQSEARTAVTIQANPALLTIEGFPGVEGLASLVIEENPALLEISGFRSLVRVGAYDLNIVRNTSLTGPLDWFPALAEATDVAVFGNRSLAPELVESLLDHVDVTGETRVGDNQGEETALDPCPWAGDGLCDAFSPTGQRDTQLCAVDPEDCL